MLNFIFKDNDNIVYIGNHNYEKKDNLIEFTYNDEIIIIEINKNEIMFQKKGKNTDFIIQGDGINNIARIKLIDKNAVFDLKVLKFNFEIMDRYIKIEYSLESDEGSLKTVEFRY